jgi:hypothetical protein
MLVALNNNDKVKIEGPLVSCYVDPLYGANPNIILTKRLSYNTEAFERSMGCLMKG